MSLDAFLSDAAKVAHAIEPLVAFVRVVRAATGIGGSSAEHALDVIDAALKSLDDHAAGKATAELTTQRIEALTATLAANNAAADAELAARFPGELPP